MSNESVEYEDRVRRRVVLLFEMLREGKFTFSEDVTNVLEQLEAVRFLPDGNPDLDTVGGAVRALAMLAEESEARSTANRIPQSWVQTEYFGILDDLVGSIRALPGAEDLDGQILADVLSEDEGMQRQAKELIPKLLERIREFWNQYGWLERYHYDGRSRSIALYGGDVFPADGAAVACRSGLFFDQILLPDPISRTLIMSAPALDDKYTLQQIIKHSVNAHRLRDFVFADEEFPPVAIVQGALFVEDDDIEREWLEKSAAADAIQHINRAFGSDFTELGEFIEWAASRDDDQLLSEIRFPNQLMATTDGGTNLREAVLEAKGFYSQVPTMSGLASSNGRLFAGVSMARMIQANEIVTRSQRYGAPPTYDVPASYQYLCWKLDLDCTRGVGGDYPDWRSGSVSELACRASATTDFLEGLTLSGLLAARRTGSIQELRKLIGEAVEEVGEGGEEESREKSQVAVDKLARVVGEYRQEMERVRAEANKIAGDTAITLTAGAVATCAAFIPNPILQIAAVGAGIAGIPGVLPTWAKAREVLQAKERLRSSPVGILFRQ